MKLYFFIIYLFLFKASTCQYVERPKCDEIIGFQTCNNIMTPKNYTGIVKCCDALGVRESYNLFEGKANGLSQRWFPDGGYFFRNYIISENGESCLDGIQENYRKDVEGKIFNSRKILWKNNEYVYNLSFDRFGDTISKREILKKVDSNWFIKSEVFHYHSENNRLIFRGVLCWECAYESLNYFGFGKANVDNDVDLKKLVNTAIIESECYDKFGNKIHLETFLQIYPDLFKGSEKLDWNRDYFNR